MTALLALLPEVVALIKLWAASGPEAQKAAEAEAERLVAEMRAAREKLEAGIAERDAATQKIIDDAKAQP